MSQTSASIPTAHLIASTSRRSSRSGISPLYVLEGRIRFRQGDDEFVAGPGTWVWGPRGVPHAFKVESEGARALVVVTPGGLERMFEEGGVPVAASAEPPPLEYDPEAAIALSQRFGFEVVGPQLA